MLVLTLTLAAHDKRTVAVLAKGFPGYYQSTVIQRLDFGVPLITGCRGVYHKLAINRVAIGVNFVR